MRKSLATSDRGVAPVLVLVQFGYALNHVLTKAAMVTPINKCAFCAMRNVLTVLVLLVEHQVRTFCRPQAVRAPVPSADVLRSLFMLGFFGVFMNQLAFIVGLELTSPSVSAAMQPSIPVFTFMLAVMLGMETVNVRRWDGLAKIFGVALVVGGALLMALYKGPPVFQGSTRFEKIASQDKNGLAESMQRLDQSETTDAAFDTPYLELSTETLEENPNVMHSHMAEPHARGSWQHPAGVLCLGLNCMMMAAFLTAQYPILQVYPHPLAITCWCYFFGSVCMGIAVALQSMFVSIDWPISPEAIIAVLYAAVVASAVNFSLIAWSSSIVGAATVSMYMTLQPLAASIFAVLLLGNPIFLGGVVSAFVVVGGLVSVTWGRIECERVESREKPKSARRS